jgi:hypothetical protein
LNKFCTTFRSSGVFHLPSKRTREGWFCCNKLLNVPFARLSSSHLQLISYSRPSLVCICFNETRSMRFRTRKRWRLKLLLSLPCARLSRLHLLIKYFYSLLTSGRKVMRDKDLKFSRKNAITIHGLLIHEKGSNQDVFRGAA